MSKKIGFALVLFVSFTMFSASGARAAETECRGISNLKGSPSRAALPEASRNAPAPSKPANGAAGASRADAPSVPKSTGAADVTVKP